MNATETHEPEARSGETSVLRRAMRYWSTRVGIAMCLFLVVIACFGPYMTRVAPTAIQGIPLEQPSSDHLFGLDFLGRDVFSRFLHGGRSLIVLSLLSTIIGSGLGTVVGLAAGYSRGWLDGALMRAADVVMAFPALILALVFLAAVGPRLWLVVSAVALTHVPRVARLVRAATLEVVGRDYISAAEARGESTNVVLVKEILPNVWTPILVDFGVRFPTSVIIISSLAFLGFGLQPPASDWGLMINENRAALTVQPYAVLFPLLAIAMLSIGANLVTDGIIRAGLGERAEDAVVVQQRVETLR